MGKVLESARHPVLPAVMRTFAFVAHVSRLTRPSMRETLHSPHVRDARAAGMSERVMIVRHAQRHARAGFSPAAALA